MFYYLPNYLLTHTDSRHMILLSTIYIIYNEGEQRGRGGGNINIRVQDHGFNSMGSQ